MKSEEEKVRHVNGYPERHGAMSVSVSRVHIHISYGSMFLHTGTYGFGKIFYYVIKIISFFSLWFFKQDMQNHILLLEQQEKAKSTQLACKQSRRGLCTLCNALRKFDE